MSRGRARAQTVERLENELEQLMAHLQTSPTPSPAGPSHSADDADADADDAIDHLDHPDHLDHHPSGGVGAEQDLDALLARLGEEEQQIRDDIKRMRDAYARSLRRGYVATKGGTTAITAKPAATTSPATLTSPQLSPTSASGGEESSDEAHEALKEAERKVTVLRRRAEEVRRSIRSQQGSQIGGRGGGGFGVHGPSVRRKRDAATVIGEQRGDQTQAQAQAQIKDGDGGGELRELERELERMEEKERARRRREAEGRARVTLEMARLLLRDEAAKRDDEERQREEVERREAERGMAEMRDRIERMRIMAQAVKPRHTPPPTTMTMTSRPATTTHHTTMMSSPLTPPSHLPPLSPVPAAALMMAARGPHLQPLTPGASPTATTQQPRQFYYTTTPAAPPMGSRPPVPPLPTPSAGPGLAPRPSFSPRATVSTTNAATAGLGDGGRASSTTEDDSELNSMMADMLTHLKATSPQTDAKDFSPPVARAGSGSGGPPPVPPKKLISASPAGAQVSADLRACGRCGKAVDEYGGGVVQAMDRRWHPACFVCHACSGELMGQRGGGAFYPRNGQPHCTACYRRLCGQ